ncbi:11177_t:CDS:2, partial [Acaulospora colombiana]
VIDAIWSGKIVYTAESSRSLLRDAYKMSPIHYYDPQLFEYSILIPYRLKIPAIRSVLEYGNFLVLFVLFVITLEFYDPDNINSHEKIFMVYATGFVLEKLAAMQEHGLRGALAHALQDML